MSKHGLVFIEGKDTGTQITVTTIGIDAPKRINMVREECDGCLARDWR